MQRSYNTQFFGYGSLVNLATHDYHNPRTARLQGWRRQWVYSSTRDVSFLSAIRDTRSSIQGMIADVAHLGWEALDTREHEYDRHQLHEVELKAATMKGVHMYVANPLHVDPVGSGSPILLSYLDCVVQGFLKHFGAQGVSEFFDSTSGWNRPIKNDRATPIYARAQTLTKDESGLVDEHLDRLSVKC